MEGGGESSSGVSGHNKHPASPQHTLLAQDPPMANHIPNSSRLESTVLDREDMRAINKVLSEDKDDSSNTSSSNNDHITTGSSGELISIPQKQNNTESIRSSVSQVTASSSRDDDSASGSGSSNVVNFYRKRFEGKKTRREQLEQLKKSPHKKSPYSATSSVTYDGGDEYYQLRSTATQNNAPMFPQASLDSSAGGNSGPQTPPRLTPKIQRRSDANHFPSDFLPPTETTTQQHNTPSGETAVTTATTTTSTFMPRLEDQQETTNDKLFSLPTRPQHDQLPEPQYFRIVYRGVVALLSEPTTSSSRSGAYVSYGEILQTRQAIPLDDKNIDPNRRVEPSNASSSSSPNKRSTNRLGSAVRSPVLQDAWQGTSSTLETVELDRPHVIRVEKVLTGGYAMDATDPIGSMSSKQEVVLAHEKTPKRNNTQPVPVVGPSPLPIRNGPSSFDGDAGGAEDTVHGYLFTHRNQVVIAEPLLKPPMCETGSFLYKVASSTPIPILTGPCADAPTTKAMLLPGTVHEVCLKLVDGDVTYLRLSRKRGWVADRKTSVGSKVSNIPTMKEVEDTSANTSMHDDCNISILSMTTSSVATPISTARRRHRPPRRRRKADHSFSLPKQVADTSMSFDNSFVNSSMDKGVMSPSSNVSLLSDESSLEHANSSMIKQANPPTPDRSVARSTASSSAQTHVSTFYLMRVNAPRGLKILDAPHFQVNNLIHGQDPSHHKVKSPTKGSTAGSNNKSIFQTMGGHHTTTQSSKISNPAIFDSITKARKLPRGSVFESSKRMEGPGAYSQGAGLIKLSDNSGWAIVPRQEELDEQYRNYHGSLTGVKEGEASRAYEEVGNAIGDDRKPPVYFRVISRGGVGVSLPPQSSAVSETNTSPTSSAGGSSSVSGHIRSQDSDVASSVGSSFLDAMFRTPKKKDPDQQSANDIVKNITKSLPPSIERPPTVSTVIPCGVCLEVEPWSDSPEIADQHPHRHEYVRLRGGQGWIPRKMNGKPIIDHVTPPEFRFGSFWFRVQAKEGIKVRLGPSRRAPSIKSDDGVYFRFECGEFLRASEVMTIFHKDQPVECFAKLYRNRHVQLYSGHGEVRQLASLTAQAEWVQIFDQHELFLEECGTEPRIERHKQGWRYNVVLDARVVVRKGPSYAAETTNITLLGGESVLVNERVTSPGESFSWLRLKDGQGWCQNLGQNGETLMIPHSLRHRGTPGGKEDIAYNTVIARLFQGELQEEKTKDSTHSKFGRR